MEITVICAFCGKEVAEKDIKGSLKHPCCPKCFKDEFENSFTKYLLFLGEHEK